MTYVIYLYNILIITHLSPSARRSTHQVPSMSSTAAAGGTSPWRRAPGEAPANLAPAPGRHAVPGTGLVTCHGYRCEMLLDHD